MWPNTGTCWHDVHWPMFISGYTLKSLSFFCTTCGLYMVRRRHSQWSCVWLLELFIKRLLAPGRFWPLVREIILLTGYKTIERFIETWLKGCTCEGRRIIFLLLQGNIFTEMNYCHENQSDLAKNLSTPLMIFSYSIKNKCSMASGSIWDDCDTGVAQGNAEKECEQVP